MENRKRQKSGVSENGKKILREFLACPVPHKYYGLNVYGEKFDFNYNYEETYDYADALLRGEEIDLRHNFVGLPSAAVNDAFQKILPVLGRRDPSLEDFCDKFARALEVIERAAN